MGWHIKATSRLKEGEGSEQPVTSETIRPKNIETATKKKRKIGELRFAI